MCIVENITKQQFVDLQNDISEIKDALCGNKYNPNGIVQTVTSLEEDVDIINKKIDNKNEIEVLK